MTAAWAISFDGENDYSRRFGMQNAQGPGQNFDEGATLNFVVTNTATLARFAAIRGLKNGEHILLRHIKDDQFELSHDGTGQKASVRLAVKK
jgi:hypothetical protein